MDEGNEAEKVINPLRCLSWKRESWDLNLQHLNHCFLSVPHTLGYAATTCVGRL